MTTHSQTRTTRSRVDVIRWTLIYLAPYWRRQVAGTALLTVAAVASLCDPLVIRWIIDNIIVSRRAPLPAGLAIMAALYCTRVASLYRGNLISQEVIQRATRDLRISITNIMLSHVDRVTELFDVGDLVQLVERDAETIAEISLEVGPTLMRLMVSTVFIFTVLIRLEWHLASIAIPAMLVILYARRRQKPGLISAADHVRAAESRRSSVTSEMVWHLDEVRTIGAEHALETAFRLRSGEASSAALSQQRLELRSGMFAILSVSVGSILCLGLGGHYTLTGVMTLGSYVAFYSYLRSLYEQCSGLMDRSVHVERLGGSVRRVQILESSQCSPGPQMKALRDVRHELLLVNGRVKHMQQGSLHGLSLSVVTGDRVLLQGDSGIGKTTLLRMLGRTCHFESGTLELDGEDITSAKQSDIRQHVRIVSQQVQLFTGTLRFNATLGLDRFVSDAELNEAAEDAGFLKVVRKHSEGWDYIVLGTGSGLSGGERHRLSLIRALLAKPNFLLLDEVTAGLDRAQEDELLRRLMMRHSDKGVVLVSHRPSATSWATRIVRLTTGTTPLYEVHQNTTTLVVSET